MGSYCQPVSQFVIDCMDPVVAAANTYSYFVNLSLQCNLNFYQLAIAINYIMCSLFLSIYITLILSYIKLASSLICHFKCDL